MATIKPLQENTKTEKIHEMNKKFWNDNADDWFGATSLPTLGVYIPSETDKEFFADVSGKAVLDIGCGSGHFLAYLRQRGAKDLWGLDLSSGQLANAQRYLGELGLSATLINGPMEEDCGAPKGHFDMVYSIYAIGWSTDLQTTFDLVASYLKPGGTFVFSWDHPILRHMETMNDKLVFTGNYHDEDPFIYCAGGNEMCFSIRKLSTYVNALAKAGMMVEYMMEETSEEVLKGEATVRDSHYSPHKAQKLPLSFVIKARKL